MRQVEHDSSETHDQEGHATTHAAQQIVTNTHSLSIWR